MVAQRTGWTVLALIAVAALAGLFGTGPLSEVTHSTPAGLVQLEHQRFARHIANTSLQLLVRPDPAQPGTAWLWISSECLSSVQVQQVQPEPESWIGLDRVSCWPSR